MIFYVLYMRRECSCQSTTMLNYLASITINNNQQLIRYHQGNQSDTEMSDLPLVPSDPPLQLKSYWLV